MAKPSMYVFEPGMLGGKKVLNYRIYAVDETSPDLRKGFSFKSPDGTVAYVGAAAGVSKFLGVSNRAELRKMLGKAMDGVFAQIAARRSDLADAPRIDETAPKGSAANPIVVDSKKGGL